ncbi:MAG TPA: hypothetical protein VM432_02130 [Bdellovibrionales bacterium]|nr:hypothetical protein [Bdellovibrionales bacterium]
MSTQEIATYVTQSRFFSPAFNAAIFDGPIRIYFAQYQEAQALKLYFNLQERFGDIRKHARGIFRQKGRNIFVMLYPTQETFELSFGEEPIRSHPMGDGAEANPCVIVRDQLGSDFVVGVSGPLEDRALEMICQEMDVIVKANSDTEQELGA